MGPIVTTIAVDQETKDQIRTLADERQIHVRNVPRLLIEAWDSLTPKQKSKVWNRYGKISRGRTTASA